MASVNTEWSDCSGQVYFGASGHRDVLLIVSEDDDLVHPDVVLRRPAIELTQKVTEGLDKQGISEEDHWNDLILLQARYGLDKERTVHEVEDEESVTKAGVLYSISKLMEGCNEGGSKASYVTGWV